MTIFIVFSVFTSRPTSLLASNTATAFLYSIYVFIQYINMVSIDQELTYSTQFQSFLTFLDLPENISQNKVERQWG